MTAESKDIKPRVRPKLNRPLRWGVFLLLIILTLVNIYFHFRRTILQKALPYITSQIKKYADEELDADIDWESAEIDVWGRVVFNDLGLIIKGETESTAFAKRITVSVDEKNILSRRGEPAGLIKAIIIDGLHVSISRDAEGKLNLSSLFKPGKEPFKPEEFQLRARLKLNNCSVDYTDTQLFGTDVGMLRVTNLRGGIDLREISDVQLALIWDIEDISTRPVTLKARSNLLESSIDISLAGEADIAQLAQLLNIEMQGSEVMGKVGFGLNSSGTFSDDYLSLLPTGTLTLSGCGFSNPTFNEDIEDIEGTLHLAFGESGISPSVRVHSENISFKYGGSALGSGSIRAGWAGEFAYAFDLDISGLKPASVKSLLPKYVTETLGLRGTIDLSLLVLGTEDGPSFRARVTPAPYMNMLGINFDKGEVRIAYQDGRLLLEEISLASSSGRTVELNGFLKLGPKPEYRIGCSFVNVPVSVASTFYKEAADWPVEGNVSGTLSYAPSGGGHKLDLRVHAGSLETKWGDIGTTVASLTAMPGRFSLDGFAAEAFGGWVSAISGEDGRLRFAASGIDGNLLAGAFGISSDVSIGRFSGTGDLVPDLRRPEFEMDLAVADIAWRDIHLAGLSGSVSYGPEGLSFQDMKATGDAGGSIELSGNIPFKREQGLQLDVHLRDFDLGKLMFERGGPSLSRTDVSLAVSGSLDDLSFEASLTEKGISILGNSIYTCDPGTVYTWNARETEDGPPVGEVNIKGKAKIKLLGEGNSSSAFSVLEFADLSITGAVFVGPQPTGLQKPVQYRHILEGGFPSKGHKAKAGGLGINGVIAIDGRFEGPVGELVGDVTLSSPSLKFGLQEIKDLRMELKAGGSTSYILNGGWKYGARGKMVLNGPAGWDSEQGAFVVDLSLELEKAPIDEVLALAGLDVSTFAEGLFDGGGRISGPIGDIALNEFKINAGEGSRLLGMSLQEGRIEFNLSKGILNLTDFEIISHERAGGGRCTIGGSGHLYLEETGLLPQAQLSANIVDYRLEDLQNVFGVDFPLIGKLDADISFEGGDMLKLVYEVRLSELAYKGHLLPALDAKFSIDPIFGRLELTKLSFYDGMGGWIDISGWVTLGILNALINDEMRRDLRYQLINLDITGENFDLAFLAGNLPEGSTFEGKLESVNLHLEGKPAAPSIDGTLKPALGPIILGGFVVADKITTHSGQGLVWEDGILKTDGDFYIRRGEAIANIVGDIDLRPLSPLIQYDTSYKPRPGNYVTVEMNSPDPLHLEGTGFDFKVVPENLRIGITGTGLDVNGRINVLSGYLDAFQIKLGEGVKAQVPVNYDITVAFGQGCRLKAGGLLEAVLTASEVHLSGSPLAPRLSGRVRIEGGKLNFLSRTFKLQPGAEASFTPLFGANPHLKAEAEAVITQHPKAQTGAEPLVITASVDSFLLDIEKDAGGIKLSSNYPSYSRNELLSILSYGEIFEAFEEEGFSSAFTSGLYHYPAGLISRYVRDIADFDRFELTLYPDDRFVIDLEKEMFFDNFILTYNQTFGEGTNYILGTKYRLQPRSYAGFRYENLDFQDRQHWYYFLEYVMPIK